MIKDITIGQYFPGNSFVHRIDPRVKILLTCLYITMVFFASNVLSFLICGVFLFVSVKASSVPFKNLVRSFIPFNPKWESRKEADSKLNPIPSSVIIIRNRSFDYFLVKDICWLFIFLWFFKTYGKNSCWNCK